MSFLDKEENSVWDWVIIAGLVIAGAGFWFYYRSTQHSTQSGFAVADSLYRAGDGPGALRQYRQLANSDYLEPGHDSILNERLAVLEALEGFAKAESLLAAGALPSARQAFADVDAEDLPSAYRDTLARRLDSLATGAASP